MARASKQQSRRLRRGYLCERDPRSRNGDSRKPQRGIDSRRLRFKLDENMPLELALDLERLGHSADTVLHGGLRGAPDPAVLAAAAKANRILLTLDKGIANIRRSAIHQHAGTR